MEIYDPMLKYEVGYVVHQERLNRAEKSALTQAQLPRRRTARTTAALALVKLALRITATV